MSPHAIAPDDVVRTRAGAVAGAREPLLVLEPLLGFLDAHGLGEGEAEIGDPADLLSSWHVVECLQAACGDL